MQLSSNDIQQFKQLWLEEFGEEIDDARALREAQCLLTLISFATSPIPPELEEEYKKFNFCFKIGWRARVAGEPDGTFTNWRYVFENIRTDFKENPDADF